MTSEARAWQAAEAEKRRKRQQGGTPLHAAAEGHQEHLDEQQDAAKDRHDARHPASGRFTTATAWPGTDAHGATADGVRLTRVGDPLAAMPVAQTTLVDAFAADALGRFVHPGAAAVQRLPLANPPVPVSTAPRQPPFHAAPTGSTQ